MIHSNLTKVIIKICLAFVPVYFPRVSWSSNGFDNCGSCSPIRQKSSDKIITQISYIRHEG